MSVAALQIGPVRVEPPLLSAPMAGFTTHSYRTVLRELGGCGLTAGELISAVGFVCRSRNGKGVPERLYGVKEEPAPKAVQIWDKEPRALVEIAARLVGEYGVSVVDLNFGCPARKVLAVGSGGRLLDRPAEIGRLMEAVAKVCGKVPVTAKIRLGVVRGRSTAAETARAVEEAGGAALTVHGRYVSDLYGGTADWEAIAELKGVLKRIPLIGNGDVRTPERAVEVFARYGVDGVMIGRRAIAEPWIFREAAALLRGEPKPPPPALAEQGRLLLRIHDLTTVRCGAEFAHVTLRALAAQYAPGRAGAKEFRRRICACRCGEEFRALVRQRFGVSDDEDFAGLKEGSAAP